MQILVLLPLMLGCSQLAVINNDKMLPSLSEAANWLISALEYLPRKTVLNSAGITKYQHVGDYTVAVVSSCKTSQIFESRDGVINTRERKEIDYPEWWLLVLRWDLESQRYFFHHQEPITKECDEAADTWHGVGIWKEGDKVEIHLRKKLFLNKLIDKKEMEESFYSELREIIPDKKSVRLIVESSALTFQFRFECDNLEGKIKEKSKQLKEIFKEEIHDLVGIKVGEGIAQLICSKKRSIYQVEDERAIKRSISVTNQRLSGSKFATFNSEGILGFLKDQRPEITFDSSTKYYRVKYYSIPMKVTVRLGENGEVEMEKLVEVFDPRKPGGIVDPERIELAYEILKDSPFLHAMLKVGADQ